MIDFNRLNAGVLGAFAEEVTVTPASGSAYQARGIFDSRHFEADAGGADKLSDRETTLAVADSEAGTIQQGDEVTVRGTTYQVSDTRPDAGGFTVLVLWAAS